MNNPNDKTITVGRLIELLSALPKDAEVRVEVQIDGHREIDGIMWSETKNQVVLI